ncbi:MAG: TRAP transporter substrate-binding protein DctP [Hyphomonadaceae bacterium]|nr:TRAP transporter substrate-binding protein DctP [Hyphomonadaceae bacterium]
MLLLGLAAAALAACARPATEDGAIILTYATPYPPTHPFSRADITWMRWVEERSNGRLRIRPYWSGGAISSESSMIEIRHGIVDIGLITPIYTRGGAHAQRTQTGFYGGVRAMQDQVDVYKCLERDFPALRNELVGLHVIAVQGGNFPGVLTRGRPIRRLEDFRGMRLRGPTEIVHVLRDLGADPVELPMGDVYSAMAKNVIDGVVTATDALRSLHLAEVSNYFSYARFPRGAYPARAMSAKKWALLPPDLQALLTESGLVWEEAMRVEIEGAQETGAAYGRSKGVQFVAFDAADQTRLDEVYSRSALQTARALEAYTPNGVQMYRRTQELVALRNSGVQALCPAEGG